MSFDNKNYICACGKEFNSPYAYSGHKIHCKDWHLQNYGNLHEYNKIRKAEIIAAEKGRHTQKENAKIRNEQKQISLNRWISEQHTCEYCGKIMTMYYGSGRFCSRVCSNSYSSNINKEQANKKRSIALKGKPKNYSKETIDKLREERRNKKLAKYVSSATGELDITYEQLEKYQETHTVCDICGKEETCSTSKKKERKPNKLCIEHNHRTNKFRGLVCNKCNNRLAWLDENLESILKYMEEEIKAISSKDRT